MTQTVRQLSLHASPVHRPQPVAFHDGKLWVGGLDATRLYALDPKTFSVLDEIELPGAPYGIASFEGALRIVISLGDDDDRYLYTFVPGEAFGEAGRIECPDRTGSHLTTDGKALYLVQQTHRRMLELDATGAVERTIPFATRCAGAAFRGKTFYMITADADFDVLELATLDLDVETAAPVALAPMHLEARGLAFDGTAWWTSYRDQDEIVSFEV